MSAVNTGRPPYQKGQKPGVSKPNRNASRGKDCLLSIPGICRNDPDYVVGTHLRLFNIAGSGQKPDDLFLTDGCDRCHAVLDSRDRWESEGIGFEDVLRALMLSQQSRRAAGLITLKDET